MSPRLLASADRELKFLIWRAEVHKLSLEEVEQALTALRSKVLSGYPDLGDVSKLLEDFFELNHLQVSELKKRSLHNPPAGLMWSI